MCLLLDMCEQEGVEKGIEKGIEQGIEKGIEQGVKKGIFLTKEVLRLDASGKKAEKIAKELNVELSIVKEILV